MNWRSLVLGIIAAIFVAPYFFALTISEFSLSLPADFFGMLAISVSQALLSAVAALLLGFVGAIGLIGFRPRWEAIVLAPAMAPSLAVVLGFMTWFPDWRGIWAVICAHAFLSAGLVAVVIVRQVRGSFGSSLELAWVEGASRISIWRRGVGPAISMDLVRLGLSIFIASFTSFSIPLLLGGSQAATLEIAIHRAIRFEGAWDIAASLSLFQWSTVVAAVFLLRRFGESSAGLQDSRSVETLLRIDQKEKLVRSSDRLGAGRFLSVRSLVVVLAVAPILILMALLIGPVQGLQQLMSAGLARGLHASSGNPLWLALQGSLVTATLAGVISSGILFSMAAVFPSAEMRRWISSYVAPGAAVTGFATLALGWGADPSFALDSIRIGLGSALLFSPILWRLRWEPSLARLDGQIQTARILGAPHGMIVREIIAPTIRETTFWSAGLVSFWVWGDYAIGSVAASRPMTLALLSRGLLESYRLEAASLIILFCLMAGALSYKFFAMGGQSVDR